jgi:hypothetical protein
MPRPLDRLRARLSLRRLDERRQADALARKLGVAPEQAERILRRSREVGFGAAMLEHESRPPEDT